MFRALGLLLGLALLPQAAAAIPTITPRVVARLPHDTTAFTEGLQLVGGTLYESTGLTGEGRLSRINLATGKVLQSKALPLGTAFGEGVTVLGKTAYQLTWQDGVAFVYDAATLRYAKQLGYQGEGWGITNDGRDLIMSNGSDVLTWRNPRTFAVTRTLKVSADGQPVRNLNELEYVRGQVYANVWLSSRIARIDPQTGQVTAWIDVSALAREAQAKAAANGQTLGPDDVPNGIAYNPAKGTFLLTGKRWPMLFEVKW